MGMGTICIIRCGQQSSNSTPELERCHGDVYILYILSTLYLISKMSAFSLCEAHHKLSTVKVWILEDLGFDRLYPE